MKDETQCKYDISGILFNAAWEGEIPELKPFPDDCIVIEFDSKIFDSEPKDENKKVDLKATQELNNKKISDTIKNLGANYHLLVFNHNGISKHILIQIGGLKELNEDIRNLYRKEFVKKYSADFKNTDDMTWSKGALLSVNGLIHYKKKYLYCIVLLSILRHLKKPTCELYRHYSMLLDYLWVIQIIP